MGNLVNNSQFRLFRDVYRDKRVLVTGHTGFKGSWLSLWLQNLGANVAGFSLYLPSDPCNFEILNLREHITHYRGDICNIKELNNVIKDIKPQIIFHLAAQPITRRSYDDPKLTFDTNLGGTVNLLECVKSFPSVQAVVIITSDKCYQNVEWAWGYRENDRLGGDDPYSASKACAEIASHSYIRSFFSKPNSPRISTVRAGNVIGGGDWAIDRIIPDCVRAFSKGESLEIRSPKATRPWQHVLEPLSGYLWLGTNLLQKNEKVLGESFNFGPTSDVNRSVEELIRDFAKIWGEGKWYISNTNDRKKQESSLLKLNCDKALYYLGWHSVLSFKETVKMTSNWYKAFYNGEKDMYSFSLKQIGEYINLAREKRLRWTEKNDSKLKVEE
ncbi:MAG: CDP-glucose 4,6-dehydratase [Candidatus Aminicenantes bacterium]|nr:CDP-glucose 4,6-dehydratase [Candidatus Aminicenantes bacterium]